MTRFDYDLGRAMEHLGQLNADMQLVMDAARSTNPDQPVEDAAGEAVATRPDAVLMIPRDLIAHTPEFQDLTEKLEELTAERDELIVTYNLHRKQRRVNWDRYRTAETERDKLTDALDVANAEARTTIDMLKVDRDRLVKNLATANATIARIVTKQEPRP